MSTATRLAVVAALVLAVAVTVALRPAKDATTAGVGTVAALPRLLDIGADKCIPCKAMAGGLYLVYAAP
jgi:hypothetical protein